MAVMQAPLDTKFLIQRLTQLLVEAADLPERSPAQKHIEELASKLAEYVSQLADEPSEKRRNEPQRKTCRPRLARTPATPAPIR